MNKKILIISILSVFMLVTISVITTANTQFDQEEVSPLFTIRTRRAISNDKINEIKDNIMTRFIENRIFYVPVLFNFKNRYPDIYLEPTTPFIACSRSIRKDGCCLTGGIAYKPIEDLAKTILQTKGCATCGFECISYNTDCVRCK